MDLQARLEGQTIGHYIVEKRLGEGGMGVVYQAEDTRLGRLVALKFFTGHLASDRQSRERFEREARTASSLNHPNICTIHDIGDREGLPFIVMELLEGETLSERLSRGTLSDGELLDAAIQIAEGLDAAHAKRIIHRDIKPGNIGREHPQALQKLGFKQRHSIK